MITAERLAKIHSSLNSTYAIKERISFHPLLLNGYDDAWELSKEGYLAIAKKDTRRPVFLRYGKTYKVYSIVRNEWYYNAHSDQQDTLGKHIRHVILYQNRDIHGLSLIQRKTKHLDLGDLMVVLKHHKDLNDWGYHVRLACGQKGEHQSRFKKLFKKYLNDIKLCNSILLTNNIKINYQTISWNIPDIFGNDVI